MAETDVAVCDKWVTRSDGISDDVSQPVQQDLPNLRDRIGADTDDSTVALVVAADNAMRDRDLLINVEPGMVKQRQSGLDVFQHVEKDKIYVRNGYTKHVWDYSIDFTGPTRGLADHAHSSGKRLSIKTETGIGLEALQFLNAPAIDRLPEKWDVVKSSRADRVRQSWFSYGMCGSRAEKLSYWRPMNITLA